MLPLPPPPPPTLPFTIDLDDTVEELLLVKWLFLRLLTAFLTVLAVPGPDDVDEVVEDCEDDDGLVVESEDSLRETNEMELAGDKDPPEFLLLER